MPLKSEFVHLHLHTHYSLLDGANQLTPLLNQVRDFGQQAVAMTDHGNLFGAIDFYQKAKAKGIKPIIGCEAYLAPGNRRQREGLLAHNDYYHLILQRIQDLTIQEYSFLIYPSLLNQRLGCSRSHLLR